MNRFLVMLLGIAVFFSGITFFFYKRFSKVKILKYLPSVFCFLGGVYYLYLAKTVPSSSGFEDLANMLISIMFLTGFASGIVTAFIIDFLPKFRS